MQSLGQSQTFPPYLHRTPWGGRDGALGSFAQLCHSPHPKTNGFKCLKNPKCQNPPSETRNSDDPPRTEGESPTSLAPPGAPGRAVPAGTCQTRCDRELLPAKRETEPRGKGMTSPPSRPYETGWCPPAGRVSGSAPPLRHHPAIRGGDAATRFCGRLTIQGIIFLQPERLLSCCCQVLSKNHQTN